jgi:hypothetical protein
MNRGLLLLDVDGPLNPDGVKKNQRPHGYETHRLRPAGWEHEKHPLRVWLCPEHGPMLRRFAEQQDLEMVWATTWEHDANRMISPRIGLPELPVIEFGHAPQNLPGWKYTAVLEYAQERPLAWLDDAFRVKWHLRAQQEFLAARRVLNAPTLLHHVDPRIGLNQLDLNAVLRWWVRGPDSGLVDETS